MHKYGESKTTRIMMATVRHVTSRKFQAAWFLLNIAYMRFKRLGWAGQVVGICDKKNPWTNTGKTFRRRRPTGKPRYRWKGEVRLDTVRLLNRKSGGQRQDVSDWRKKTGDALSGIGLKGESNNNNNNNNSVHCPLQKEKEKSNTSPYPVCVCPFFQFSNRLTDSTKTWCQH
jgi:hypothetical protein